VDIVDVHFFGGEYSLWQKNLFFVQAKHFDKSFHQNLEGQEKSFFFKSEVFFFKFSFSTLAKTVGSVPFKYFFFVHSFFLKFSKVGSKIMLPIN